MKKITNKQIGFFYIVELTHKQSNISHMKLGFAHNVQDRMQAYKSAKYLIHILYIWAGTDSIAHKIEQLALKDPFTNKHTIEDEDEFYNGMHEARDMSYEDVDEMRQRIEKYKPNGLTRPQEIDRIMINETIKKLN